MSNALLHEIDAALAHHELIKIKIAPGDRLARTHLAREIAAATGSAIVQTIGRTVTLYRRGTKPRLSLP